MLNVTKIFNLKMKVNVNVTTVNVTTKNMDHESLYIFLYKMNH